MSVKYAYATSNLSTATWLATLPYHLAFTGSSSQYVRVTSAAGINFGTGAFSISFWCNPTLAQSSNDCVISKDSYAGGSSYTGWAVNNGGGKWSFFTRNVVSGSGPANYLSSSASISTGLQHVVAVRDGSSPATLRLYINGSADGTLLESSSTNVDCSTNLTIGAINGDSLGQYFDGNINNVMLYNTALTSGNVTSLYAAGAGCYNDPIGSGLVAYWRFDDGTGTSASDSAGTYTGTLINTPSWSSAKTVCLNTTTAPGSGDNADLNGKTITVDQTWTCDNIIGSGTLSMSGSRTINANIGDSSATFSSTLNGASQTATINGNVLAATGSTRITVSGSSTTLNVTGNVTGGSAANIRGITQTNGTVSVVGNVNGGSASSADGVRSSAGTLSISGGTITGGSNSSAYGLILPSGSTAAATITANAVGGSGAIGIYFSGGTHTLTGNATGSSTNNVLACGIQVNAGTVTQSGTVTGGSGTATSASAAPYGTLQTGGTYNLTGSVADGSVSAVCKIAGTYNYTPTDSQTYTTGGKVLYPSRPIAVIGG